MNRVGFISWVITCGDQKKGTGKIQGGIISRFINTGTLPDLITVNNWIRGNA
jgi:hypothetical protein